MLFDKNLGYIWFLEFIRENVMRRICMNDFATLEMTWSTSIQLKQTRSMPNVRDRPYAQRVPTDCWARSQGNVLGFPNRSSCSCAD